MNLMDIYNDIKEVNFVYLMLVQNMVCLDCEVVIFCFGISVEIVDIFECLMLGQVFKMVSFDMLLCNFCFDDILLLNLFFNYECDCGVGQIYVVIFVVGKLVEVVV